MIPASTLATLANMTKNQEAQGANAIVNNIGNANTTTGIFTRRSDGDSTIDPNEIAIQQMHALGPLGWKGGDKFWDGPHDGFCFVCGSPKGLFQCQTCESCYHADCMTPSLNPDEVPTFWFCPHCVGNELHVPPLEEHFFAPLPSSLPIYPSAKTPSTIPDPLADTPLIKMSGIPGIDNLKVPSNSAQKKEDHPTVTQQPTPPSNELPSPSQSRSRPQETLDTNPRKAGRPRNKSPPRKKSKYSAFSKEVDKALSVIYSELETAAGYGKSEGNLENKVQALEQQLRMQEGQMMLTTRELDLSRKELKKVREDTAVMKVDNFELRGENTRLKEDVKKKESELKEWRVKLRSMIGSEFE